MESNVNAKESTKGAKPLTVGKAHRIKVKASTKGAITLTLGIAR